MDGMPMLPADVGAPLRAGLDVQARAAAGGER